MKILVLCHDPLFPPFSGQRIRSNFLIEALAQENEVTISVPGGSGWKTLPWQGGEQILPRRTGSRCRLALEILTGRSAFRRRFSNTSIQAAVANQMATGSYDLVVTGGLPMAAVLQFPMKTPLWVDEQNLEWRIVDRYSAIAPSRIKRWAARREATALRLWEESVLQRANLVTVCSIEDRSGLPAGLQSKLRVLENTCTEAPPGSNADLGRTGFDIVFTGTMCWEPNVDAATWFVREIFPALRRELPQSRFVIVGRDPSPKIMELKSVPGVEITGSVPSVFPYLERAKVCVAPLRMGSGTRIKILEAASIGLPCISTTVGAEGLEFLPQQEIALADNAADFCRRLMELMTSNDERDRMGRAAKARYDGLYARSALARRVCHMAQEAANKTVTA